MHNVEIPVQAAEEMHARGLYHIYFSYADVQTSSQTQSQMTLDMLQKRKEIDDPHASWFARLKFRGRLLFSQCVSAGPLLIL